MLEALNHTVISETGAWLTCRFTKQNGHLQNFQGMRLLISFKVVISEVIYQICDFSLRMSYPPS